MENRWYLHIIYLYARLYDLFKNLCKRHCLWIRFDGESVIFTYNLYTRSFNLFKNLCKRLGDIFVTTFSACLCLEPHKNRDYYVCSLLLMAWIILDVVFEIWCGANICKIVEYSRMYPRMYHLVLILEFLSSLVFVMQIEMPCR